MQLNQEGQARFRQHLNNVIRKPCAVCGSGNWQIDDTLFELRQFNGGPLPASGAIKPVMTLSCSGCGNLMFFSPITTGIVQMQQAPAQQAEATPEVAEEISEEASSVDETVN